MKLTLLMVWIGLASVLSAASKIAVVRVTDIYRDLPSTVAMQAEIKKQLEEILKGKRAENLRKIASEIQALEGELQAKKDELKSEEGKKLIKSYEIKRSEAESLKKDFENYQAEETKRINRALVTAMRETLNRISAATQQVAKERNLDGVFDTTGNSNTGVPFVLYAKDAEDITADVIAFLGEKPVVSPEADAKITPPQDKNQAK